MGEPPYDVVERGSDDWFLRFGTEIRILALLSGAVALVDNDWFGPGEPVVACMGFLIGLAGGGDIVRHGRATRKTAIPLSGSGRGVILHGAR